MERAIELVIAERKRQIELWGDQSNNHPFEWISILGEEYGELCEAVNESCFKNGKHPERGGAENVIKEAIHVAAVAVAIAEAALAKDGGAGKRMRNPCYQCPRRESGCHDRCEEFAVWRAGNQKIADARRANEHAERDIEITKKKYRRSGTCRK